MEIDQSMYVIRQKLVSKRIIFCVIIWTFIFIVFYLTGQIYEGFNTYWMFNPGDPISFAITSITSVFLHQTLEHLLNNMIIFVIFGSIFFTLAGVKKGSSYIILLLYFIHILEWIIFSILKILFDFLKQQYMEAYNIQEWSFEIYPLRGLGASGMIAGIIGFVIVIFSRFEGKKEFLNRIRKKPTDKYNTIDNVEKIKTYKNLSEQRIAISSQY